MPPSAIKTLHQLIFYQYAKIVSAAAGFGKKNYGMIMSAYKTLCAGDGDNEKVFISNIRKILYERSNGNG